MHIVNAVSVWPISRSLVDHWSGECLHIDWSVRIEIPISVPGGWRLPYPSYCVTKVGDPTGSPGDLEGRHRSRREIDEWLCANCILVRNAIQVLFVALHYSFSYYIIVLILFPSHSLHYLQQQNNIMTHFLSNDTFCFQVNIVLPTPISFIVVAKFLTKHNALAFKQYHFVKINLAQIQNVCTIWQALSKIYFQGDTCWRNILFKADY